MASEHSPRIAWEEAGADELEASSLEAGGTFRDRMHALSKPNLVADFGISRKVKRILARGTHAKGAGATMSGRDPMAATVAGNGSSNGHDASYHAVHASMSASAPARAGHSVDVGDEGADADAAETGSARSAHDGQLTPQAKEVAVVKSIVEREGELRFVKRTCKMLLAAKLRGESIDYIMKELFDQLLQLRGHTIAVIESTWSWMQSMSSQAARVQRSTSSAASNQDTAAAPTLGARFVWDGRDYLRKIRTDLDFIADMEPLLEVLGVPPAKMRCNPFMGPETLVELADAAEAQPERPAEVDLSDAMSAAGPQRLAAAQAFMVQQELASRSQGSDAADGRPAGRRGGGGSGGQRRLKNNLSHPLLGPGKRRKPPRNKAQLARETNEAEASLQIAVDLMLESKGRPTSKTRPNDCVVPGVFESSDGLLHLGDSVPASSLNSTSDSLNSSARMRLSPLPHNVISSTYHKHAFKPNNSVSSLEDMLAEVSVDQLPMVSRFRMPPSKPPRRRGGRRSKRQGPRSHPLDEATRSMLLESCDSLPQVRVAEEEAEEQQQQQEEAKQEAAAATKQKKKKKRRAKKRPSKRHRSPPPSPLRVGDDGLGASGRSRRAEAEAEAEQQQQQDEADERLVYTKEDIKAIEAATIPGHTLHELRELADNRNIAPCVSLVCSTAVLAMMPDGHIPHDVSWAVTSRPVATSQSAAAKLAQFKPAAAQDFIFRSLGTVLRSTMHTLSASDFEEAGPGAEALLVWLLRAIHADAARRRALVGPKAVDALLDLAARLPGFDAEVLQTPLTATNIQPKTRREMEQQRQQSAAVAIQSAQRRKLATLRVTAIREEKAQEAAATSIQAVARQRRAKKVVQEKRENVAATNVQRAVRGKLARARVEEVRVQKQEASENAAAQQMQRVARGRHDRDALVASGKMEKSAIDGRMLKRTVLLRTSVRLEGVPHLVVVTQVGSHASHGYLRLAATCASSGTTTSVVLPLQHFHEAAEHGKPPAQGSWPSFFVSQLRMLGGKLVLCLPAFSRRAVVPVSGQRLMVRVLPLYAGHGAASSGFLVTSSRVDASQALSTVVTEQEAAADVLSPPGAAHDDAMRYIMASLSLSGGQLHAFGRHSTTL